MFGLPEGHKSRVYQMIKCKFGGNPNWMLLGIRHFTGSAGLREDLLSFYFGLCGVCVCVCACCWWSSSIGDSQEKTAPLNCARECQDLHASAQRHGRSWTCACAAHTVLHVCVHVCARARVCACVCVDVKYVSWQPRSLSSTDVAVLAASSPNALLLARISVILSATFINQRPTGNSFSARERVTIPRFDKYFGSDGKTFEQTVLQKYCCCC